MSRPRRHCSTCNKLIRPRGEATTCRSCSMAAPNAAEPRDEQMESLYHGYRSMPHLVVPERKDGTRFISLSDTQAPFVDEPLLEAVERFMRDWQPDDIAYNGDMLDMYEISDFDKRPRRQFDIETEEQWARDMLDRHAAIAPKAKRFWVDGNHEERLVRYVWRHAGPVAGHVKSLREVLGLDERNVGYVPYGKHVDYLGFVITHGNVARSESAMTARAHLQSYNSSGVNGHTHRLGSFSKTDMHGRTHTWFEQGCLCRVDLEYVRGVANWQQGLLIGTVAGGALHPQLIHVIEAKGQRGFYAEGSYYRIHKG